jgi:hypothetical protein
MLDRDPDSAIYRLDPVPQRGVSRSSRTRERDAVDAAASGAKRHRRAGFACERWTGARTNGVETPRAEPGGSHTVRRKVLVEVAAYGKAVWSWHPLLVSSWRRFLRAQPGGQAINPPTTVARRIRRRGERGISRKTIAQGEPGVSGYLWSTVCIFCTRTAGAEGTRLSLRPLISHGAKFSCTTRAHRAAGSRSYVCRHCEPTGRADARPMTGSAKQSMSPRQERMDCFRFR